MPPTTSFEFGDIVLVEFMFTDRAGTKKRPAVVVSSRRYNESRLDVILMAITSQVRSPIPFGETAIAAWREAGLLLPGVVKPVLLTLEKSLVLKRLGRLEPQDRQSLSSMLSSVLGPR